MFYRRIQSLVVISAALLLVSCQPREPKTQPGAGIPVEQLASELGLPNVETGTSFARLTDSRNAVYIVTDPQNRIYVNGKEIDPQISENIAIAGGRITVPESAAAAIRPLLKEAPELAPAQPGPRTGSVYNGGKVKGTNGIDPGHGGKDTGAIQNGDVEKKINLAVALEATEILRARGVKVTMTRTGDTFPSLDDRVALANRIDPDLFVSIHTDSIRDRSFRGYTIYTAREASAASKRASQALFDAMDQGTTLGTRGQRQANYVVLRETQCPAVLVEMGYLSNAREADLLTDPAFQQKIAEAIADGICGFLQK